MFRIEPSGSRVFVALSPFDLNFTESYLVHQKGMCCFCVEVDQNGPHKVLPFICFEIYGLGGSGADQIRCRPIFQGFKMTKMYENV